MQNDDLKQMVFALIKQNNAVIEQIIKDYEKEIRRMKVLIEQYEFEMENLKTSRLIINQYKKAVE